MKNKTKVFIVGRPEAHIQYIRIRARNEKEAMDMIDDGDGDCEEFVYSHVLPRNKYTIQEEK